MAANLRAKISKSDQLLVTDRNKAAVDTFVQEVGTAASSHGTDGVEGVKTAREVAERSVRALPMLCGIFAAQCTCDETQNIPSFV